jgi:prepilin-type N-terminal cleavage/methylation domain-containing protein
MTAQTYRFHSQQGFTLIEMAMVLMIVALLLGGLLPTLSSQVDQRHVNDTRKQLDEIQQALIGYAVINGRLPCPAAPNATGVESPAGGNCTNFYNGLVPATTLGLSETDSSGYINDAWGNPIHYAVSLWSSTSPAQNNVLTSPGGMSIVGISNLSDNTTFRHLLICSSGATINASTPSCGASGTALVSNPGAVAVIYSTGKNGCSGCSGGTGIDETANPNPHSTNNDKVFVSHTPTPSSNANGEFDDIVAWISPDILVNRMVVAGKLP